MKNRSFPKSLLVVLAAALLAAAVPVKQAFAQSQTDSKIRLMSEALRARDAGDLAGAQKALTQLAAVSPNDPAVQRLRSEIEAQTAAQQAAAQRSAEQAAAAQLAAEQAAAARAQAAAAAPAPAAVATPAKAPASAMIDVKIPEPGQPVPPSGPTPEQEAEALARAESARVATLMANAQTQLATARSQLRDGRADDALATVDAALGQLPVNPLTQKLIADLNKEKASALLDRAQTLLKRGDIEGARAALAAHGQLAPASTRAAGIERQLARAAGKPSPAVDPTFAADRAATAELVAKGRAQYLAGDVDGAQQTFRAIEAQEPENTVAKGFLLRIAEGKAETGALNREKTRAQLLEEVAKG